MRILLASPRHCRLPPALEAGTGTVQILWLGKPRYGAERGKCYTWGAGRDVNPGKSAPEPRLTPQS